MLRSEGEGQVGGGRSGVGCESGTVRYIGSAVLPVRGGRFRRYNHYLSRRCGQCKGAR